MVSEKVKEKEKKQANLLIRLTEFEKKLLQNEAGKQGLTTSQLVRNLIIVK